MRRTGDLLGVNELHGGRCRSLAQVAGLCRSHEVGAGRRGCCTSALLRHEAQCCIARAAGRDERRYLWI
jgi:hypothetical protein